MCSVRLRTITSDANVDRSSRAVSAFSTWLGNTRRAIAVTFQPIDFKLSLINEQINARTKYHCVSTTRWIVILNAAA